MKKILKIVLITAGSLLGVVVIALGVTLWLIFTPAKLTGIVNKVTDKVLTCESHFETVDLTLFKTFPEVGLKVGGVVLINPTEGAQSDTLASIDEFVAAFDLKAFLKQDSVKVDELLLNNVQANLYINENGEGNYNIFSSDTTAEDTTETDFKYSLDVKKVAVNHLMARYYDARSGMNLAVENANLGLNGSGTMQDLHAELTLTAENALVETDSLTLVTFDTPKSRKNILEAELEASGNLDDMTFEVSSGKIALDQYEIQLNGDVALANEDRDMQVDVEFETGKWKVPQLLSLLPQQFTSWQKGMEFDASVAAKGTVKGIMNDTLMPLIKAQVTLEKGSFAYTKVLPYKFNQISGEAFATLDLSKDGISDVELKSLSARTGKNRLKLKGTVSDLLGKMDMNLDLDADVRLKDIMPLLPDDMALVAEGDAQLKIHAITDLAQIEALDLARMKANGTLKVKNLEVDYDSITAESPEIEMNIQLPAKKHSNMFQELASADIRTEKLKAHIPSAVLDADLEGVNLSVGVSDFMDENTPFSVAADFDFNHLAAIMDTLSADIAEPHGSFVMAPQKKNPSKVKYQVDYSNRSLLARMGEGMDLNVAGLNIKGTADYDSTRSNILKQWNPDLDIEIMRGVLGVEGLPYSLQMPDFKFNYQPEVCEISSANLVFGNSDYYLSGKVYGLEDWISHEGKLEGDLNFTSNFTNVDDLLEVLSGLGTDSDTLEVQMQEAGIEKESGPFIVPKDVNFTLHTNIRESVAFGNELQDLAGNITINDGVAILDQVGFVCKAARMQLTAMYKSPRPNHLFLGLDFHLLDIQIDELIDMIPYIDTVVPMLSAFNGNADFHISAETYLFSDYSPKVSTMRGAAALTGKNLVVLDNETFDKIATLLMFKKKTENRIDSLDVEMTLFRDEVELYPFLLSMDRYQLCASGRHTLENAYNYHLEILHSPVPGRLAVDVKGVLPKLNFSLGKVQYEELYKPEKKGVVENHTLELKQMIRQALESNVRETTRTRERENQMK